MTSKRPLKAEKGKHLIKKDRLFGGLGLKILDDK